MAFCNSRGSPMAVKPFLLALIALIALTACFSGAVADSTDAATEEVYDDDEDNGDVDDLPMQEIPEPNVQDLSAMNFDDLVNGKSWIIMFYAPSCGHCARLKPTWDELSVVEATADRIAVGRVDCTRNKDLCLRNHVRGYPTVRLYRPEGNSYTYAGDRSLESFVQYVGALTRDFVDHLTTEEHVEEIVNGKGITFVYIQPRVPNDEALNTYTAVAADMLDATECAIMDPSLRGETILKTIAPGSVVRVSEGTTRVFEGDITNYEALNHWIQFSHWPPCFELTRLTGNKYALSRDTRALAVLVVDENSPFVDEHVQQYTNLAEKMLHPSTLQYAYVKHQQLTALTESVWALSEADLPTLIVHDAMAAKFFAANMSVTAGDELDIPVIHQFLDDVIAGKVIGVEPHSILISVLKFVSGFVVMATELYAEAPLVFFVTTACVVVALAILVFSCCESSKARKEEKEEKERAEKEKKTE